MLRDANILSVFLPTSVSDLSLCRLHFFAPFRNQSSSCSMCLFYPFCYLDLFADLDLDCKTVGFFSKLVRKKVKCGVRVLRARRAREKNRIFSVSPQSRSLFSASFDCSRVLVYPKLRTVLQSKLDLDLLTYCYLEVLTDNYSTWTCCM